MKNGSGGNFYLVHKTIFQSYGFLFLMPFSLDTSDWMRNGDYLPSRIEAQQDAANIICGAKTQQNPENTVGLLAMAGKT